MFKIISIKNFLFWRTCTVKAEDYLEYLDKNNELYWVKSGEEISFRISTKSKFSLNKRIHFKDVLKFGRKKIRHVPKFAYEFYKN